MHIEPGVVQGAKLLLSVGTALTAGSLVLRQSWRFLVQHGLSTLLGRTICTSVLKTLIDLSLLAGVKILPGLHNSLLFSKRLFQPA